MRPTGCRRHGCPKRRCADVASARCSARSLWRWIFDPRVGAAFDDEMLNVLFVGRLIPNKRPDLLIRGPSGPQKVTTVTACG